MSRTKPSDIERAWLMVACTYCGAPAGTWCMAQGSLDDYVRGLHAPRWEQVNELVRLTGLIGELDHARRVTHEALRQLTTLRDKLLRGDDITRDDLELPLQVLRRG